MNIGVGSVLDASWCLAEARAFVRLRRPSYFLFAWPKRKLTKEKGHPAWRLPPIPGRQVREAWPGFSTAHPVLAKRDRHRADPPAGLSSPPHRRTGATGRAARSCAHFLERQEQQSYNSQRNSQSKAQPTAVRLAAMRNSTGHPRCARATYTDAPSCASRR